MTELPPAPADAPGQARVDLADWLRPEMPPPARLPAELARWHAYTSDGGHSVFVIPEGLMAGAADNPLGYLVPAPVRAVERVGWREVGGWLVVDLPYDPQVGLVTSPEDDEF